MKGENTNHLHQTAASISTLIAEGLLLADSILSPKKTPNIFGRPVNLAGPSETGYIAGLAASGCRTAVITGDDARPEFQQLLKEAEAKRLSIVVYTTLETLIQPSPLKTILCPGSLQELHHFGPIAHRLAELSLCPVVVYMPSSVALYDTEKLQQPLKEEMVRYLGRPEDTMAPPTPSQEIIFGKKRPRVPAWFHPDLPAAMGMRMDENSLRYKWAADQVYFGDHLPELIDRVFQEWKEITGFEYERATVSAPQKSDRALVICSSSGPYKNGADKEDKSSPVVVGLKVLCPFPFDRTGSVLEKKKQTVILAPDPVLELVRKQIKETNYADTNRSLLGLPLTDQPTFEDIHRLFEKSVGGNDDRFSGVCFYRNSSQFPKHEVLLQTLRRSYPGLATANEDNGNKENSDGIYLPMLPEVVKEHKDLGPPWTALSGFLNHTAMFYRKGVQEGPVAHPFYSTPVPALSSLLNRKAETEALPVFQPENCTACLACYTACPHAALPPLAIGMDGLIQGGIDLATSKGQTFLAMTPHIKGIARMAGQTVNKSETPLTAPKDFLPGAFSTYVEKAGIEGEKLETLQKEFGLLTEEIASLPVAATDLLWKDPESYKKGSGAVFTLAVNLTACTGCGICADSCEDGALEMRTADNAALAAADTAFRTWEGLPDTDAEVINGLLDQEGTDPFAALQLGRGLYYSVAGSTQGSNDAAKTIVRKVVSVTESIIQPRLAKFIEGLEEQITALSENIHGAISGALPRENFNAVYEVLRGAGQAITINDLMAGLKEKETLKQLDPTAINRKIALLNDLRALKWEMEEGPTGQGRARFGIVLAPTDIVNWGTTFPDNPFSVPVMITESPEAAIGISDGLVRYWIDNIRLVRRAALEIKGKYDPDIHDLEIASLGYSGLTDEEKGLLPPVLVVGGPSLLHVRGLTNNSKNLPVKIIALDPLDTTFTQDALLSSVLSASSNFVHQGAAEDPRKLFQALVKGLDRNGPAVFRIFAPESDPQTPDNQMPTDLPTLAAMGRALPTFTFDPMTAATLSAGFDTGPNPSPEKDFHTVTLSFGEGESKEEMMYQMTFADYAFGSSNWGRFFTKYTGGEDGCLSVAEYLDEGASNKAPVVLKVEDNQLVRYKADDIIVHTTKNCQRFWTLLRELSGTMFTLPEQHREAIKNDVAAEYETQLSSQKAEYEAKLQAVRAEQMEVIKKQLKNKLLQLSGVQKG